MSTLQGVSVVSLGGPSASSISIPIEPPSSGTQPKPDAGPSTLPPKSATQRIRPGILSRQASEREEADHSSHHLQSASEDDDASRQSDTGSLPQRFPKEPNSAASSLRNARSSKSYSPLSANFKGGEGSASSSRSHLPLQSKTSLYARQVDHDGTRAGDWSEDGSSGKGANGFGTDALSRAKSVSSVSSVNSTSSMEAVPFRAAPLGKVRVGYAGRRKGRGDTVTQEKIGSDSTPLLNYPGVEAVQSSDLQGMSSSPGSGKQRILPKDPSDEWHYRNPPGMGTKSGARNALGTYQAAATPQNIERRGAREDVNDTQDIVGSPTSTLHAGRIKPSIRSKLAKRAGKLGLKPLTTMAIDYSMPPKAFLQEQSIPSQVVETRDPNNGSPVGSVTLPAISLSSASIISSDGSSRGSKSYFASSTFPIASPLGLPTDGDQPKLTTSSVTYAPLVVPKHPPGPPGSGPPPSPGLTGAPSPYHPFALASPLISPQQLAEEIDPLSIIERDLKIPEGSTASVTRSYDTEPSRVKRGSFNGLLNNARIVDTSQRHSLPAPPKAPSPRRPSTSPTTAITPAQQIQKDVQAGIARAPAEPSGSNPGSNPVLEQVIKKEAEGVAVSNRLHAYSARVESDFLFGDILGEGSYSTVLEAWDLKPLRERGIAIGSNSKTSSNLMSAMVGKRITAQQRSEVELAKMYAIKVLDKVHILKEKKQKYVGIEREAMSLLIRHPGVITLYWTFHDRDNLYFIMELASNGELLSHIKKLGSFDIECTRYYGAQLVETIEAIHQAGVLHRDLKPENILLNSEMRIKVADFGSAKLFKKEEKQILSANDDSSVPSDRSRTSSFVGTAEYVSPELLAEKQVSEASDWWALGCLLFQMLCGRPPFKGASEYQTFQKIMKREFEYPPGLPADAISLLDGLFVLDADQRFTYKDIREHVFFEGHDWDHMWKGKAPDLKVGIYQRPAPSAASTTAAPKWDDGSDSLLSRETNIASMSEDGSRSAARSVQESMNSMMLSDEQPSSQLIKDEDADDDDSSFSDSNSPTAPRKRGLSVGASAAQERRLSLGTGNGNGKKAGDFFRMAAGMITSDNKPESSKAAVNGDSRPSSFNQPSFNGSGPKQASINRNSTSSLFNTTEPNKVVRGSVMSHSKTSSIGTSAHSIALATSWAALLLPNESLLYSCPILHKTTGALLRSGTKKRQLLLTDFPRLLCVKETNNQLRVKSEVILGLPQLASMPLINHPWNADDEDDDDDEEDLKIGYSASEMRRQSSAGPSLASPSRATATMSSSDSSGYIRAMERRESFPTTRQQPLPKSQSSNNLLNHNNNNLVQYNSNTTLTNNNLNNTMNRLPGLFTSSATTATTISSTMASTMDTSPNFMTSIEQKSIRTFMVTTPAKTFLYEDPSGDATHWVKSILLAAAVANRASDATASNS